MLSETRAQDSAQTFAGCQESPNPLDRRLRNLAVVSVVAFVIGIVGYFGYAIYQVANRPIAGLSVPNDFSVMWGAAKLALDGQAIAAFDFERLAQVRSLPPWTGEAGFLHCLNRGLHLPAGILLGLLTIKAALLTFAVSLVTPYAYLYDLVLPVIGVGLLLAEPRSREPVIFATAAIVWALPTLGHTLVRPESMRASP